MNILVTGSNGQLGREIESLQKEFPLRRFFFYDLPELDITDSRQVESVIQEHGISVIINCAAYTAVDQAEDDADAAFRVNRDGPAVLAGLSGTCGIRLVHVSTDYVFNGESYRPYTEDDSPSPLGVYGQSKWEGEQMVRTLAPSYMIFRTSWLYSTHGNNFVKTMLRLGKERESLGVIFDQTGTPTFAGDLARTMLTILEKMHPETAYRETYHFSNEGVCSWYDFAVAVMRQKKLPCKIRPIETAEFPVKAKRPPYSVLNKAKIKKEWQIDIPHWQDSLTKVLGSL